MAIALDEEDNWLGDGYRLPTEAEWEWAARAGTSTRYWSGDAEADLRSVGWYAANSAGQTHPVSRKRANPLGLFDVHGNVWEWCHDWYAPAYPAGPVTDPRGAPRGVYRVIRGGSWFNPAEAARSADRVWWPPTDRDGNTGFRLVRALREGDET